MAPKTVLLAALTALATAQQQSVLTLPFFGYDEQKIDASVVAVEDQATTLSLQCPPGTDGSDCGLGGGVAMTVGPSTYHINLGDSRDPGFTMTQDCSTFGTTSAVCAESAGGSEANSPGMSTATYDDGILLGVTVTAGLEQLAATASTPASTSAMTTSTGSTESVTLLTGTATTMTGSTGSPTGSAASTSSTDAASKEGMGGSVVSVFAAAVGYLAWIL